jgi:hypothetical protein
MCDQSPTPQWPAGRGDTAMGASPGGGSVGGGGHRVRVLGLPGGDNQGAGAR